MLKNRVIYLDLLKIFAAILVIFNHYSFVVEPNTYWSKIVFTVLFTFCKIAVPLFIMISGALLLGKKTSYKEFFLKRVVRIFVMLVAISIIYVYIQYDGLNFNNIGAFLLALFVEYDVNYIPYWIWYLYMLMALYIMTPFLQKMIKNFKDIDYKVFFIIFVVIGGFMNFFGPLTQILFGEIKSINTHFVTSLFSVAVGLYVLGYYISSLNFDNKKIRISWLILIISLFSGMFFVNYGVYHKGYTYDEMINCYSIFVVLSSLSFFILIKYYFDKKYSDRVSKIIVSISNSTFGVYLTHVFLYDFITKISFIQNILSFNRIIGCLFMVLIAFILLTGLFYILRKIPFVNKFL